MSKLSNMPKPTKRKRKKDPFTVKLTGPDGAILFFGTENDFKLAAAEVKAGKRPALLEELRRIAKLKQ